MSKKRWGAPSSALENERLSLFIAATANPVHYEIRVPNYIFWLLSFMFYIFRSVISSLSSCRCRSIHWPELSYIQIVLTKSIFYTTLVGYLFSGLLSIVSLYTSYIVELQELFFTNLN